MEAKNSATAPRRQAVGSAVRGESGMRGEGAETTEPFELPAGTTVVEFTHTGDGAFAIDLLDAQGNAVERIAAGTGETSATKSVEMQKPGEFRLRIAADSSWEIAFRSSDSVSETESIP